ncbi:MAG: tetratricopeptide repeat protein [Spirochaetaceae bacterium]|nr:MAG: tetratricopeptide repeat protein [Spirochaetaceae bacterium]
MLLTTILVLSILACRREYSHFLVGSFEENRDLHTLFDLLQQEQEVGENRFIIVQQIANRLHGAAELEKLILFLTSYVEINQNDPYNAYYLNIVAAAYRDLGAEPMAVHYYDRILKNYPDLLISGTTVHFQCLQELLRLVEDPHDRIEYYKELISRFSEYVDPGATYFYLAEAYETVGEWEQAIRAYQKFLNYPETEIPGFPRAHVKVREKVEFYFSDKKWTVENLEQLVAAIKRAIQARNARQLLSYKAQVNFFTVSWAQADTNEVISMAFDIGAFLQSSRVLTDDKLDIDSNAGEAFLRTTRWSYRIPTWYLYFRKVEFLPDPEINGRWEWAGIYFGEKL